MRIFYKAYWSLLDVCNLLHNVDAGSEIAYIIYASGLHSEQNGRRVRMSAWLQPLHTSCLHLSDLRFFSQLGKE